jgi:BirA family biotin operon repressor/biotin-[acetyl-CoA-carboxylase] ligase
MIRQNSKLVALVALLCDQQFHGGLELGKYLGVSRTAIWKMIDKLTDYQIPIARVKGKGYALKEPLSLLDKNKLQHALKNTDIQNISIFESIPSTQTYLSQQPATFSFDICLAETQTQGRGRLNRSWNSPFGKNIYMSISRLLKKDLSQLSGLTLVVALSLAKAIDHRCQFPKPIAIKWPNDLLYDGMKLSGILVEIFAEANGFSRIIIGIGVNVNLKNSKQITINAPWTSLSEIGGQYYERNALISTIINELTRTIATFETNGFAPFVSEWRKRDYLYGQPINATTHSQTISGKGVGITPDGHLKIMKHNDQVVAFSAGDISLHNESNLSD